MNHLCNCLIPSYFAERFRHGDYGHPFVLAFLCMTRVLPLLCSCQSPLPAALCSRPQAHLPLLISRVQPANMLVSQDVALWGFLGSPRDVLHLWQALDSRSPSWDAASSLGEGSTSREILGQLFFGGWLLIIRNVQLKSCLSCQEGSGRMSMSQVPGRVWSLFLDEKKKEDGERHVVHQACVCLEPRN